MLLNSEEKGLALIWTFRSDIKAEQAKLLLENNGYFACLNNSYSSTFNYYEAITNMVTGTIRLYTKQSQAYDAYVLLALHDFVPMRDILTSNSKGIDDFQKLMSKIPFLKSQGIVTQILLIGVFIAMVSLLIFIG